MSQEGGIIVQWEERKLQNKSKKKISCIFCHTVINKDTIYYYTKTICFYFVGEGICSGGNFCCHLCKPNLFHTQFINLLGDTIYNKIESK